MAAQRLLGMGIEMSFREARTNNCRRSQGYSTILELTPRNGVEEEYKFKGSYYPFLVYLLVIGNSAIRYITLFGFKQASV